jgi:hypothetical protein
MEALRESTRQRLEGVGGELLSITRAEVQAPVASSHVGEYDRPCFAERRSAT